MKKSLKLSFLVVFALLLQQCKLYKTPENTKEMAKKATADNFEIPDYWSLNAGDTLDIAENWYKTFNNDQLNVLVEEALDTSNFAIIFQLANIDVSTARAKLAKSGKSIKVNYGGFYSGVSSTGGSDRYDFTASAPISWEADLWGKIEAGVLAADENVLANMYNYSYTRQSIAATVSSLYFKIGALNKTLEVGQEFLELNIQINDILEIREQVGIIDAQEVFLTEAQVNNIKSIIAQTENDLQKVTRELELILGRYPKNELKVNFEPGLLNPIESISNPIELINRRPDIKANEARVRALFYLNEQAKLAKYPSLVLSGSIGISTLSDLIFGTGASLLGPIFDGGAINSKIQEATAIQKQAVASYGLSILTGFKEVEASMNSEKLINEQYNYIVKSAEETKKAYEISVKQYGVGRIDLFSVLQLQAQWILTELDLISVSNDIYQQRIQLHLALGGNITSNQ